MIRPLLLVLALVGGLAFASAPTASARFDLALDDLARLATPAAGHDLAQAGRIGFRYIRQSLEWRQVAPDTKRRPRRFHPADPRDRHYHWRIIDAQLRAAAGARMTPLVTVLRAPRWAEGPRRPHGPGVGIGAWEPNVHELRLFVRAAARRYSGHFPDPRHRGQTLPRVRYWEAWNEENLPYYFATRSRPVAAYRRLLNAFYDAVKSVDRTNVVVVGGLAPRAFQRNSLPALRFAASLLCTHRVGRAFLRSRCPVRPRFDVLGLHPYTIGNTPTKHGFDPDTVLVADIGKVARLLRTARRYGNLGGSRHPPLWVTEFAWFTNPPDRFIGDAPRTAARYVALSLYLMWHQGVQLVTWQVLRDFAAAEPSGGGLLDRRGHLKLMARAVRFPLFARVSSGRGYAWAHAPATGPVVLQQREHGHWRRIATSVTRADRTVQWRFRATRNGSFRAIQGSAASLAYDSRPVPPRRLHALGG